jgi:CRP-like cAMP-binding protein
MALIDDGVRCAAAIATEPTEVVIIDKPAFLAIIRSEPQFALRVMSLLATRLRRTNKQI